MMILDGPYSLNVCNGILFVGRFFFLLYLTEITLWQATKYLYIFQWKYLVALNDQFVAICITICAVTFSIIFISTTYMLGYQNAEIDFHICTGNSPHDNIIHSRILMNWMQHLNKTSYSFQDVADRDPLLIVTQIIVLVLIWITFHIWIFSQKYTCSNVWNFLIYSHTPVVRLPKPSEHEKMENFQKSKNSIIGAGGTFISILLIIILLVPSFVSKSYARKNIDDMNYGTGKFWTYLSWITVPIFSYCQLPTVILLNNSKMRKYLFKKMKTKIFGEPLQDLS
jgi:hypothetical protein